MKTILVTGATGFLGTHLLEKLTAYPDIAVRILFRSRNPWAGQPRIEAFEGDVLDPGTLDRAVAGVSVILHLAGSVSRNPKDASELFDTHIQGTRNVCESALAHGGTRLVVVSSSGTIASSRGPVMHTEDFPYANDVAGHWPYYLSKIYQEKLAFSYHAYHGLPVVVINPSLVLGPGDTRRSSTRDVEAYLDGHVMNVPSGGMNFVDVRDTADVLINAIEAGVAGRRYLIGAHNFSVKEFFAVLERVSGVRAPALELSEGTSRRSVRLLGRLYRLIGRTFPVDDQTVEMAFRFWYFDNSRAKSELGLNPRPAEQTLRDTVEFIRSSRSRANGHH